MPFAKRLDHGARLVDARLSALFDEQGRPDALLAEVPDRLLLAMRHAVLGGGKRIRPFLVLESSALFGCAPEKAVDAAAALELVHCYSLAHDDLPAMDNDELRRGRPTVWKAFDEWTAILAGDALQTLAFELLSRPEVHADPAVRLDLMSCLSEAAGARGMAGGQALDLAADKLSEPSTPDAAHVRRLQAMKTGALIRCAVEMGAILGGATAKDRDALRCYGQAVGLAFQIADDLLDAEGDANVVGKAVLKDRAAGKATLVSLLGMEAARGELARAEQTALDALTMFGDRAANLRAAATFVVSRES